MIGRQVGNFRIVDHLGEGGMAVVYKAEHVHMGTPAAVKVLASNLARNDKVRTRFTAEASVMAHLRHSNIVAVLDFIVEPDVLAIVMEFLDGPSLEDMLRARRTPMTPGEATPLFRQILEAVGFAHSNGVVHRDLKPSNVMIVQEGTKQIAKVLDFGLVKILGEGPQLTRTGAKMGTLWYMSPEQCEGARDVGPATDIYALGVTLYQMLTANVPFGGVSDYKIMKGHIELEPPRPSSFVSGLPSQLEQVVLKALTKDPAERWESCAGFLAALDEGVDRQPEAPVSPPSKPTGSGIATGDEPAKPESPVSVQPASTDPIAEPTTKRAQLPRVSSAEIMKAAELCGRGRIAEREGRLEESLAIYGKAVELDPSNRDATTGEERLEEVMFTQSIEDAQTMSSQGKIEDAIGRFAKATEIARRKSAFEPRLDEARTALVDEILGSVQKREDASDLKGAMTVLEEAAKSLADCPRVHGKWEALVSQFRKMGFGGMALARAKHLIANKLWSEAYAELEKADKQGIDSHDTAPLKVKALAALASEAIQRDDLDEASSLLTRLERIADARDPVLVPLRSKVSDLRKHRVLEPIRSALDDGQLVEATVMLNQAKSTLGADHPKLKRLRNRLRHLRARKH